MAHNFKDEIQLLRKDQTAIGYIRQQIRGKLLEIQHKHKY